MPFWGQLGFQDAASPIMVQLIQFHDHAMTILVMIMTFVAFTLASLMMNSFTVKTISENHQVETIWTIVPGIILLSLALPSLRLLYLMDEVMTPALTVKAIGNQWYWSYEYTDFTDLGGDSYMLPTEDLTEQTPFRLLEVDNRLVLPCNTNIRMLVTASDVMHSWTVPSLGVKADAVPGRLNQLGLMINTPGIFYGQCSEICGANHSFMPIALEARSPEDFMQMVTS
uniref:Cytochrome c oxidase subunit 2 n=1 Tax=Phascolosoma sp. MZK-2017 TaxID=1979532 RepID=A0A1W5YQC5_9ANNE|nr:cytochrome c oxidase subunit II [Phascolosoma sp. MZK-2017]